MAKIVRRSYTTEEKIALVTEIERRNKAGEESLSAIARTLGIGESNYHNWKRAGIKPRPAEPEPPRRVPAPRPYAPAERERLLAEVERLRAGGAGILAACRQLGISEKSYRKWSEDAAPPPAMRPVEVTALVPVAPELPPALTLVPPKPVQEPEWLTLMAPGGYRIEGLDVASAAALLRALSC